MSVGADEKSISLLSPLRISGKPLQNPLAPLDPRLNCPHSQDGELAVAAYLSMLVKEGLTTQLKVER